MRTTTAVLAGLAGLVLASGCAAGPAGGGTDRPDYFLDVKGMAAPAQEFTTVGGEKWAFRDVAEDRLTLLYFGYTSCPDVCPTTMADVGLALDGIGADAEKVDVVMVSTDPERDTDEQLRTWLDNFDPDFEGVRGPIDEVVAAAEDYGIPVEAPKRTGGDYLVTHGGRLAVLVPGGDAIGFFDEGTSAEQMSAVLPDLVRENL
ncbi:SCO family protein [Murinocardiopsis flavida]|uniref:SCO family protein n=1 Tax=Murinocardiopsis flavida TaxID=645275 RepID=UPI001FE6029E|nr:SCO family protein [Murinocardiopsis flavida]